MQGTLSKGLNFFIPFSDPLLYLAKRMSIMKIRPEIKNFNIPKNKPRRKYSGVLPSMKRIFYYIYLKMKKIIGKKRVFILSKEIDHEKKAVKKFENFILIILIILKFISKLKFRMSSRRADFLTEKSVYLIDDATNFAANDPVYKNKWIHNKTIQNLLSKIKKFKKQTSFFLRNRNFKTQKNRNTGSDNQTRAKI